MPSGYLLGSQTTGSTSHTRISATILWRVVPAPMPPTHQASGNTKRMSSESFFDAALQGPTISHTLTQSSSNIQISLHADFVQTSATFTLLCEAMICPWIVSLPGYSSST